MFFMDIIEVYSFNKGLEIIREKYNKELKEVVEAVRMVNSKLMKTKVSKEKTMSGKKLFSPVALNKAILDNNLYNKGWSKPKIALDGKNSFIEADGVKGDVGLEVQFGKYAFLGWDIFGKMPIFAKNNNYKVGIEIVPTKNLQKQMSTGVGSFTHIVSLLEKRGVSNVDIPILILGIGEKDHNKEKVDKILKLN